MKNLELVNKIFEGNILGSVPFQDEKISFQDYAEGKWLWDARDETVNLTGEDWYITIETKTREELAIERLEEKLGEDVDFTNEQKEEEEEEIRREEESTDFWALRYTAKLFINNEQQDVAVPMF